MAKKPEGGASPPAEDKEEGARSFGVFLRNIDQGAFEAELSEELHELCKRLSAATYDTGKDAKGELTVKLSFTAAADRAGTVMVSHDVKSKHPKPKRSAGGVFWFTKGDNLDTKHPTQQELPLRAVEAGPAARDLAEEPNKPVRSV